MHSIPRILPYLPRIFHPAAGIFLHRLFISCGNSHSLEALAVKKQFTALFSDEEANNALMRLVDAGYGF